MANSVEWQWKRQYPDSGYRSLNIQIEIAKLNKTQAYLCKKKKRGRDQNIPTNSTLFSSR